MSALSGLLMLVLVATGDVINPLEPQVHSQVEFDGWISASVVTNRRESFISSTGVKANDSDVSIKSTVIFTHKPPDCGGIGMKIVTIVGKGGLAHKVEFFDTGLITIGNTVRKIQYQGRLIQDEVKTVVSIRLTSLETNKTFYADLKDGELGNKRLHVAFNYLGSEYMKISYTLGGISRAEEHTVTQCVNSTKGIST